MFTTNVSKPCDLGANGNSWQKLTAGATLFADEIDCWQMTKVKHTRNAGFNQSLKTRRVLHVQSSLRYRKAAPAPQAIPNALPTLSVEAHALTNLLICNISLLLLYKCGPPLISNSKEPTRTQAHFYSCKLRDAVTWRQAHFSETPRKPWTAVR
jgi:hypothetical protein